MRTWYSGAALAVALMGAVAFTNGSRKLGLSEAKPCPTDQSSSALRCIDVPRSGTAPIEGRVMDLVGDVIQYAHVRITDETTGASIETLSTLNGRFLVANLEADHTYAVDVRCIGYIPWHAAGVRPTTAGAALDNVAMEPIKPLSMLRVAAR